jgi:hypothetical protein
MPFDALHSSLFWLSMFIRMEIKLLSRISVKQALLLHLQRHRLRKLERRWGGKCKQTSHSMSCHVHSTAFARCMAVAETALVPCCRTIFIAL